MIGVDVPARVRTAADVHELHRAWLVAQAAGWLRVDGGVALAGAPAGDDLLEVW